MSTAVVRAVVLLTRVLIHYTTVSAVGTDPRVLVWDVGMLLSLFFLRQGVPNIGGKVVVGLK